MSPYMDVCISWLTLMHMLTVPNDRFCDHTIVDHVIKCAVIYHREAYIAKRCAELSDCFNISRR